MKRGQKDKAPRKVVIGEGYLLFDKSNEYRYWLAITKKPMGPVGVSFSACDLVAERDLVKFPERPTANNGDKPRRVRLVLEVID